MRQIYWHRLAMGGIASSLLLLQAGAGMGGETNRTMQQNVAAAPPSASKGGDMGFVFSVFAPAIYPGFADNCPDGYSATTRDNYLKMISSAERARLLRPENEKEFEKRWKASAQGPNHTNLCSNYDQFPERPLQNTVQGKVAYGLDLDGDDGANDPDICPHQSFLGPNGEKGIDNQVYRAMGCQRGWRAPDGSAGDTIIHHHDKLVTGERTIVMILRGVDNLKDDDDVQVIVASSLDVPAVDAQQQVLSDATFRVADNPRWRNVLHGHIKDGVLKTDPHEIILREPVYDGENGPRMLRTEWTFTKGRLQLTFQPDGTVKGILGGYVPPFSQMDRSSSAGLGSALIVNYDCASSYNTMKKLADGGRDPKTGQCTTISTAYDVAAVPAFVSDRASADARADAGAVVVKK